jgi:hypothetical protein
VLEEAGVPGKNRASNCYALSLAAQKLINTHKTNGILTIVNKSGKK